ncbi:MAG: hypothetical protein KAQ72_00630 [Desulfobacula sp.]|nr:hypothetical protein [Desulfobacula sp.]
MVRVIAHRGARSLAPENTLIAAKIAYETGADLWETDITATCDGHLVLFHDETLLRCTNATTKFPSRSSYLVRDFCLEDIQSLDAGSYFIDTDPFLQILAGNVTKDALLSFKKQIIPTLEQGLLFTKKMNWKVNLELKSYSMENNDTYIPDQTLERIYRTGIPLNRVAISSFNHDWLERVMIKEPKIEIQALVGENDTDPLDFKDYVFPVYNVNADLIDPEKIGHLKAKGKKINLFTINDPKTFLRFVTLGVDGIFTDFPQLFAEKS